MSAELKEVPKEIVPKETTPKAWAESGLKWAGSIASWYGNCFDSPIEALEHLIMVSQRYLDRAREARDT